MSSAESKNHHYVPRSLLRGFAVSGDDERVVGFDKLHERVFDLAIENAGAENHFNTVDLAGERINLEHMFNGVDGRLATLLTQLRERRDLDWLDETARYEIAYLAVLQLFRVKLQRTTMVELPRQLREVLREFDPSVSSDVVPDIDDNTAKASALRMLSRIEHWVPSIVNKDWMLHAAPAEHPFWISDCPVVTVNVAPYGNAGLDSPGVQICWPLSRDLLISFLCRSWAVKAEHSTAAIPGFLRSQPTIPCMPENVQFYNSLQVLQSARFVYGPTGEFAFAKRILKEHPDAKHRRSRVEFGRVGAGPRQRNMPGGKYLVVFGARTHFCCRVESWSDLQGGVSVIIEAGSWVEAQRAVADAPQELVELYDDGVAVRGMREVVVCIGSAADRTVIVKHRDPALAAVMASVERPR